ncbi:15627_t:CDS:2, partial [Dentiscutata erythropus]
MGCDIESGEEIQDAIKDLAGTHIANIIPNCEDQNKSNTKMSGKLEKLD